MGRNKELVDKDNEKLQESTSSMFGPDAYDAFCKSYGKSVTPGLKAIDRLQARSMGRAFTKVVR